MDTQEPNNEDTKIAHDSMSDLEVTDEQAEQARAGDGSGFQSEYKYVTLRTFPE